MVVRRLDFVLIEIVGAIDVPESFADVADAAREGCKVEFRCNNGRFHRICHLFRLALLLRSLTNGQLSRRRRRLSRYANSRPFSM